VSHAESVENPPVTRVGSVNQDCQATLQMPSSQILTLKQVTASLTSKPTAVRSGRITFAPQSITNFSTSVVHANCISNSFGQQHGNESPSSRSPKGEAIAIALGQTASTNQIYNAAWSVAKRDWEMNRLLYAWYYEI
jgi:hypothetical protein